MSTLHASSRRALAVLLVTVVAVGAGLSTAASGLEQEGFTIAPRETIERDYPPIPAPEPASVTLGGVVGPDECAAVPSCHLVAIEVQRPAGLEPGDDFYLVLSIAWEYTSDAHAEDLDVFLYDDGQTAEAEGSSGYTEVGSSASSDNPERIQVYEPLLGTYNLVVQNFTGVAVAWHLQAKSIVGEFESPFEALAPAPGGGTSNPSNKPTTTTTMRTTTTTMATTTTVSIPQGVVLPDDDFQGGEFDPGSQLEDELAAAQDAINAASEGGTAEAPSALTVLLSMVVIPLAILTIAGFLILRRRGGARIKRATA